MLHTCLHFYILLRLVIGKQFFLLWPVTPQSLLWHAVTRAEGTLMGWWTWQIERAEIIYIVYGSQHEQDNTDTWLKVEVTSGYHCCWKQVLSFESALDSSSVQCTVWNMVLLMCCKAVVLLTQAGLCCKSPEWKLKATKLTFWYQLYRQH